MSAGGGVGSSRAAGGGVAVEAPGGGSAAGAAAGFSRSHGRYGPPSGAGLGSAMRGRGPPVSQARSDCGGSGVGGSSGSGATGAAAAADPRGRSAPHFGHQGGGRSGSSIRSGYWQFGQYTIGGVLGS